MAPTSEIQGYIDHVSELERSVGSAGEPLKLAVGGEFEAVGKLELYLLRSLGLSGGHLLIDVGCGSGRLACQLAPLKEIGYIGTDVVPRLIEAARILAARDDWQFVLVKDLSIPCPDTSADFVAFFSVLTHLTHDQSFRYFLEAARCLKKGGLVVASFLEFRIPCHWETFIASVRSEGPRHLNQFIDRDAITAWAAHSGLVVESLFDGDKPHIPIPEIIRWENGICMESFGNLGQSVAVLRKL